MAPTSSRSWRPTLSLDYGQRRGSRVGCASVAPRERSRDLEVAKAFGQRVREVRVEKGMTQEQLAEAAGLHPTFVSNIERGYRVPTIPTLLRMSQALGVRPGLMLDGLTA